MMTVKNSAFKWISTILASAMLIAGLFILLKQILVDRVNSAPTKREDINAHINFKPMPLPGFIPNQKDNSMTISFFTPRGMIENEPMAKSLGIYKLYKSTDSKKISPESIISISFCKKENNLLDLNKFILGNLDNATSVFFRQETIFGPLRLPKDVVKKFVDMHIPHQAVLLLIDPKDERLVSSCAIFFFETPAGFWSINWTAPREMLVRGCKERNAFLSLIKFMTIEIYNLETKSLEIHM